MNTTGYRSMPLRTDFPLGFELLPYKEGDSLNFDAICWVGIQGPFAPFCSLKINGMEYAQCECDKPLLEVGYYSDDQALAIYVPFGYSSSQATYLDLRECHGKASLNLYDNRHDFDGTDVKLVSVKRTKETMDRTKVWVFGAYFNPKVKVNQSLISPYIVFNPRLKNHLPLNMGCHPRDYTQIKTAVNYLFWEKGSLKGFKIGTSHEPIIDLNSDTIRFFDCLAESIGSSYSWMPVALQCPFLREGIEYKEVE